MKWLVIILAVMVGIVGFAYVKHVDTSREALRVMSEELSQPAPGGTGKDGVPFDDKHVRSDPAHDGRATI